ncbi:MAG: hypothetical protein QM770_11825 [Tepidisphaeraceae bacterium]
MLDVSVSGTNSNIALIVATMDLLAVRSITRAVRANLIAAGGVPGPLGTVEMPKPVGDGMIREPRFEPRWVYHPTPRFTPRPVHHPDPIFERPVTFAPLEPERPSRLIYPLLPPWKQLPPPRESVAQVVVKYAPAPPDHQVRGSILDVFL